MRITHSYQTRVFSANNEAAMNRIAELQAQISSASRVLDPADDPAASSKSILLNQSLGHLTQFDRNNTYAESRLSMEEHAIASLSDVITSIRVFALQANNDSMSDSDRQTVLQRVNSLAEELRALANSKGPNGEYLFSGTERDIQPYPDPSTNLYEGNDSVQMVNIGHNNQIPLGTSGTKLLNFDINGGSKAVFTTISDLAAALSNPVTPADRPIFHAQMESIIEELDAAHSHINTQRSVIGDRLSRISTARETNDSVELKLREELDTTTGLDYAAAISRLEAEIQNLEAIQSTYSRLTDLSLFKYL